jgi:PncC family amidohydrolase
MAEPGLRQLAERLQAICLEAGLTVATAESCTGGRIADALTDIAGSSGYVRGGVVAYADAVKREVLGVPSVVIEQHGAVSAQVARAMAAGARARLGVDLAVAVTGIAGPSGATPGKPIGLTYVALADPAGIEIRRFAWSGDREANKAASARVALELLVERAAAVALAMRAHPRATEPMGATDPVGTTGPGDGG